MVVVVLELWGWKCYREKSLLTPTLYTFEKCSFFIPSPGCPLLLCHYRRRRPELIASMQRISAGVKPETCYSYLCEHMCMHIWSNIRVCICIHGCVHICIHMHACCPDGGGSSGEMVGVKHLCGSKPRSGQLQRPMFKVNGGLRWLFISRLLHPRWTPSANRHQPSSSSLPFSLSIHRDRSWTRPSTGIHFILCVTPPSTFSHIHTLTHAHTQRCLCISKHHAHGSTHHPCTLLPRRAWALSWPLNLCVSREEHPDHPNPSLCVPMAKVVTPLASNTH